MIKYSSKGKEQQGVQKGAKKEYFDKLKVCDEETDNYMYLTHEHTCTHALSCPLTCVCLGSSQDGGLCLTAWK